MLDKLGRSWLAGFSVLLIGSALAGVVLWKTPGQWTLILDWWQEMSLWIIGVLTGIKTVQKIGTQKGKKPASESLTIEEKREG